MTPQEDNIQLPPVQQGTPQADPVLPVDSTTVNHTTSPASPLGNDAAQAADLRAEDVDLIEKEWVEKAKSIVQGTMGDPHAQSEKITQMKADYIKQRYNKVIRPEEK